MILIAFLLARRQQISVGQLIKEDSSPQELPSNYTIVSFEIDFCGHCKKIKPVLAEIAAALPEVTVETVDCRLHGEQCYSFRVTEYPTLILFQNGARVSKYIGPPTAESIKRWVEGEM